MCECVRMIDVEGYWNVSETASQRSAYKTASAMDKRLYSYKNLNQKWQ